MNSLYQIENSKISEKLDDVRNYLSTIAMTQSLHQTENYLFKTLLAMGKIFIEGFIKQKGNGKNSPWIPEDCEKLPFNSIKNQKYLSIFGNIDIKRAYFWKKGFQGYFPLDAELNLPIHFHSHLLDKWIQGRITQEPYDEAIDSICDLLNINVSKRVVQQITHEVSLNVENFYSQKTNFEDEGSHIIAQVDCKGVVMVTKERPESKPKDEAVRRAKGVSKIGIRRDAVVTTDFTINPISRTPKELLEGLMLINSDKKKASAPKKKSKVCNFKNKQVAGTMFGKDKAYKDLADRIKARDPLEIKPIFILIDGAASLEKGFITEFKSRGWESRVRGYCLDIVHATEYLWDASTALYGETSPERVEWVRNALIKVLSSNVKEVIKELNKKIRNANTSEFVARRLKRSGTYFENHKHMMDYKRYLKEGYPIASGAIEGACNTLVKDRTDRSGMKWTKKGAAAVINIRSVQCNKDWNDYWDYHIQEQSKRQYGKGKLVA